MILEFFRFELRQQLRSPLLWLFAAVYGLLAFALTSSEAVQMGGAIGNVDRNAPVVIVNLFGNFSVVGLFAIMVFVAGALLRDFEQGTADLFFATPMRKRDYLIGRLAAALVGCLALYVLVALGMMLGPFMLWVDPERVAAFSLRPYLWGFAVFVLPNLIVTGALLTLLALSSRKLLVVYLGAMGFFLLNAIAGVLMEDMENDWLATLLDPFGLVAFDRSIRYWSADEYNRALPAIEGFLLVNRLLWSAAGLAVIALAFALFKPLRAGTGKPRWWQRRRTASAEAATPPLVLPKVSPRFDAGARRAQFLHALRMDLLGVFRSVPFLVMLAFSLLNFLGSVSVMQSMFGTKTYPTTALMLEALQGTYSYMLIFVVLYYAGELVFRERSVRLAEVIDAMPVPNWLPLTSKFVCLVAVVACFQAVGAVAAMGYQLVKGYTALEPALYLQGLLVNSTPFVLMGGLALAMQVLTNNRFAGYGVIILVLVVKAGMRYLHLEHNLYNYGHAPAVPYSDLNGYGHFLEPRLWFTGYWGLFLLALLLLSAAFWVRGVAPGWRGRMAVARERLRGRPSLVLAGTIACWAAVGGFIFWNTNVLNRYLPSDVAMDEQAEYETRYRRYKGLPQPRIVAVDNRVDLYPERLAVTIAGRYRIVNQHAAPIRELHVRYSPQARIERMEFGGAKLVSDDRRIGYRIYRFDRPMQAGEQRNFDFRQSFVQRGFGNEPDNTSIVENGTFFNSNDLPHFGYNERGQLEDRNERRKRGLGELPRMAKLEDQAARANHYISTDSDWIAFRTSVCTAPDQIALAPGYLQREYRRDGRRCFDYAMDRPMMPFYAYLSARWEVRRAEHQGVPIEIYYDARHAFNVDRMIDASRKSLDYFQANFTPYQHRQVRILEFPGYERFAQSFANTIPFSESIGFIADLRDPDQIDYVFYVTAHEIAHQWWAHQVIGAATQGSTVLSESLSQYSALMVMEKEYGRAKMRRFLKYELDEYLSGRGGERVEELPLARVEDQPYVHYRKGSLVFYRLREELGEAAVNRALQRFLRDKAYQAPPYTNSAELLGYLRAEAKPEQQRLIGDLFEKISFYDNRVVEATSKRRADGKYEVTMRLHAAKRYADGKGKESPAPMDDWIEIGVFARGPSGEEADEKPLWLERRRVLETEPTLTVVVDEAPYEVGFDPYNKLIDRVPEDNRKKL
ncbi:M1 family aminopeptidase [Lysobacter firmicutimachus]|uniref:M1 family aminopeptidase n=1 Tax=Lysobacter firmicutimachus TaxID=1792846 RepID=A0AAU8MSB9_9GAMM